MTGDPGIEGLIISVGGSPDPLVHSIDTLQPRKIIFFVSRESREQVELEIRPRVRHRWRDTEIIQAPDAQDLGACLSTLTTGLPTILERLDLSMPGLVVDFTGGTKTMSSALVMATLHGPVHYVYVAGGSRAEDGLGNVLTGSEYLVATTNPWDSLERRLRASVAGHFNELRFERARQAASEAKARVGEGRRPLYVALEQVAEAYHRFEVFDYSTGARSLKQAVGRLKQFALASSDAPLTTFCDDVDADLVRLSPIAHIKVNGRVVVEPTVLESLSRELVASAVRAARLSHRPDDGVARLYSALEKIAKGNLLELGIDNSNAEADKLPGNLRDEYKARYTVDGGRVMFGLHASYRLLASLGVPVGMLYDARQDELKKLLDIRNNSLLVHGWNSVSQEVFDQMLGLTLEFLGVEEASLPVPPRLPW